MNLRKGNQKSGYGIQSFCEYYHPCCVDVIVEDGNACEAARTVHVSKILVTGWAFFPVISLKITREGELP